MPQRAGRERVEGDVESMSDEQGAVPSRVRIHAGTQRGRWVGGRTACSPVAEPCRASSSPPFLLAKDRCVSRLEACRDSRRWGHAVRQGLGLVSHLDHPPPPHQPPPLPIFIAPTPTPHPPHLPLLLLQQGRKDAVALAALALVLLATATTTTVQAWPNAQRAAPATNNATAHRVVAPPPPPPRRVGAFLKRAASARVVRRQTDGGTDTDTGSGTGTGTDTTTDPDPGPNDNDLITLRPSDDDLIPLLNFDDPTGWDYDTPFAPELIAAVSEIGHKSVYYVDNDIEVGPDGEVVDPASGGGGGGGSGTGDDGTGDGSSTDTTDIDINTEPPNLRWVQIQDATGQYLLTVGADNNLHLSPSGSSPGSQGDGVLFGALQNVVIQDSQNRPLFYYPDVVARYGVSRVRVGVLAQVPRGARVLTLLPIHRSDASSSSEGGGGEYVGVDPQGNVLFPITCTYADNRPSRIFLAASVDRAEPRGGPRTLMSDEVQSIVTGGEVRDCGYLPWTSPGFVGLS